MYTKLQESNVSWLSFSHLLLLHLPCAGLLSCDPPASPPFWHFFPVRRTRIFHFRFFASFALLYFVCSFAPFTTFFCSPYCVCPYAVHCRPLTVVSDSRASLPRGPLSGRLACLRVQRLSDDICTGVSFSHDVTVLFATVYHLSRVIFSRSRGSLSF